MHEILEGAAHAGCDVLIQVDFAQCVAPHDTIAGRCSLARYIALRRSVRISLVFTAYSPQLFSEASLGQFDGSMVFMTLPDVSDRERILRSYLLGEELSRGTNLREIAHVTEGFTSDELATLADLVKRARQRRRTTGTNVMTQEEVLRIVANMEPYHPPPLQRWHHLLAAAYEPFAA